MPSSETTRLLRKAIELAQSGHRDDARPLLRQVLVQDPSLPLAWLWLAAVSSDEQERISALQRVLALDPNNTQARQALEALGVVEAQIPADESFVPSSSENVSEVPSAHQPLLSVAELTVLGIAVFVAILLIGSMFAVNRIINAPTDTPTATNTATVTLTPTPSDTPTPRPTNTPLPPRPTLPPLISPTPTFTPPPTNTRSPIIIYTPTIEMRSEIFGG
ncbi:MAG: hypothetical protein CUN55_03720 [Phototrophicales bacterium]|nr:MAG: hypothetical protein CUN55_03720 [Phototrophicales bacterium]